MKFREDSLKQRNQDINASSQYTIDKKYNYWVAQTTPIRGKRVVKILQKYFSKNTTLLDVGSSQALTFSYLAQAFPKIVGIDIDKKAHITAVSRLRRLKIKNKIIIYNGKKIPFKNNTFEGIVSTEVFEHVDNRKKFIKELFRVLKPGGKLLITAPNKLYPIECEFHLPFLSYLPKNLADNYVRLSKKGNSYDHVNHPTYWQFKNHLKKYFKVKDITFEIVKDHKKYYLDQERGTSAILIGNFLRKIDQFPQILTKPIYYLLSLISPGWIFICSKQKIKS